jgi:hypothetical protein
VGESSLVAPAFATVFSAEQQLVFKERQRLERQPAF